jgi:pilus assembly protein CpaB
MRRGGLLILLIGLILIVGAVALFLFLQPGALAPNTGDAPPPPPTEVPQVEVVRARVDIPAGTVILNSVDLLEVTRIPQPEFNERENVSRISQVEGLLTTRAIRAGELISPNALTEPGLSQQLPTAEPDRGRDKAYPLIVNNLSGVADQLKPGDFVDVIATFAVDRRVAFPTGTSFIEVNDEDIPQIDREFTDPIFRTTKTIIQRAQVLRIIKPAVAAEGEPTPEAGNPADLSSVPQVDASGQPITGANAGIAPSTLTSGIWTVVLAVNNQEVELIEFSLATEARIVLVLRGAGDTTFEPTIGVTYDLLISEFGVPLPRPLPPRIISEEESFIPDPTQTPAPTRVP